MQNYFNRLRRWVVLGVGFLSLHAAFATTVSYDELGTFTAPSLTLGGVLVTGSGTVSVANINGLGVVGGSPICSIECLDGTEYLDFDFSGLGGATAVSYRTGTAGSTGGGLALRSLEIFGIGGGLLGQFNQDGAGTYNLTALVGDTAIQRFRLQMRTGYTVISSVSFSEVPEPATWALVGLALAGVAGTRSGLRRRPTKERPQA